MSEFDDFQRRLAATDALAELSKRLDPLREATRTSGFEALLDQLSNQTRLTDRIRQIPSFADAARLVEARPVTTSYEAARSPAEAGLARYRITAADELGERIRSARRSMKLNQSQFADAAGVGRRFVSELENGKPSLEFQLVLQCCAAAGIDIFAKPRNA